MSERTLVEIVDITSLNLEDIKGCYDPSKAGFDIGVYVDSDLPEKTLKAVRHCYNSDAGFDVNRYLALPKKIRDQIYWKQSEMFFNSPFNGGTVKSFLDELKYDKRFTDDSIWLLFTDGSFHSKFDGGISKIFDDTRSRIKETGKLWFFEHLRGYGFEHYLDGISGFGGPYSTRIDLNK